MNNQRLWEYGRLSKLGQKGARLHIDFDTLTNEPNKPTAIAGRSPDEIKKKIIPAIKEVTTEKQFLYIAEYFIGGYTIPEIAEMYGVNKATVSRTIKRGLANCRKMIHL